MIVQSSNTSNHSFEARVNELRDWIQTYRKWKHWQKGEEDTGVTKGIWDEIVELLQSYYPVNAIFGTAKKQNLRGMQRLVGLRHLTNLLKEGSLEVHRVNLVGILVLSLLRGRSDINSVVARNINSPLQAASGPITTDKMIIAALDINLGCCDKTIQNALKEKYKNFVEEILPVITEGNCSLATKVLALGDIYGFHYDETLADMIHKQQLIPYIVDLITKTQLDNR
eukprot:UN32659